MTPLHVAPPSDRSVLGIMVDYAKMLPAFLEPGFSDHSGLMGAEELLWDNPCHAGKAAEFVVFPRKKTSELLLARPDLG